MRFVLLLVAAIIAVVAGIAALQFSSKNVGTAVSPTTGTTIVQSPSVETVQVLVAKAPIAVGTPIDETMIDRQPWPENLVLEGFIVEGSDEANIVGKIARAPLQTREPFLSTKLANPNDPSFLAAALPPGKRAVTIATDAVAGVAGYVFPGDNIDILLTHNVPQDIKANNSANAIAVSVEKPAYTEVLATNVRVLAINVRDPKSEDSAAQGATPSSLTVEVSEEQAQQLKLGEKVGTLSVVLRSLKDKDNMQVAKPTGLSDMSNASQSTSVKIVRGASKDTDSFIGKMMSALFAPARDNPAMMEGR